MSNKNENYFSSTTIYVNSEQLSDPFRTDEQYLNEKINQLNKLNGSYQNDLKLDDDKILATSKITDTECNQTSSTNDYSSKPVTVQSILKPRPQIVPRVSLLTKKLKQKESDRILEQKLDQIDENLNLVLKEYEDKFKEDDQLINKLNDTERFDHLTVEHHNSNESDLYLSNDEVLQTKKQESTESNDDKPNLMIDQLGVEKIDKMNRNIYISNSDVNEQRFSNNYNELEPIYSDIIFEENKRRLNSESIYDYPSPTNSIKFVDLQPPPLPPRTGTKHFSTAETIKTETANENSLKNAINLKNEKNGIENDLNVCNDEDKTKIKICSNSKISPLNDLQIDLKNELKNHFKTDNFISLSNSLPHNSSSLNNSFNNAPFSSTNPFLNNLNSQPDNSDLKLNELKENLNSMRKDHFKTLNKKNEQESSKLNKDDLLMFERQLDEFNSNIQPKPKKLLLVS